VSAVYQPAGDSLTKMAESDKSKLHTINLLLSDPTGKVGISIVFQKPPGGIALLGLRHPLIMRSQRDKAQTCFLSTKIYKASLLLNMGGYSFPLPIFPLWSRGDETEKLNYQPSIKACVFFYFGLTMMIPNIKTRI
jgi:hypothetical protein